MITGTGVDIVDIARIEKSLTKKGFLEKVFSEDEIAYCQKMNRPGQNFAGRFAAKEALVKALGEPFYFKFELNKVEILNDVNGKPDFKLNDEFQEYYRIKDDIRIHLSISHCHTYAIAIVTIEKI
jgi:holo-[acyl-carrier protein] synthase